MDFLDVLGYVLSPCLVILIANVSNAGAKLLQLCLTLCDPMDYSPPGFSVHGVLQLRILEWVANSFCRRSS